MQPASFFLIPCRVVAMRSDKAAFQYRRHLCELIQGQCDILRGTIGQISLLTAEDQPRSDSYRTIAIVTLAGFLGSRNAEFPNGAKIFQCRRLRQLPRYPTR